MSSPLTFSLLKTSFWGKKYLLTAIGKKDKNKIQMIKIQKDIQFLVNTIVLIGWHRVDAQ